MVYLIGGLLAVVLLYFWLMGHWFASVLATPVGLFLGVLFCSMAPVHEPYPGHVQLALLGGGIGLAWLPFALRRFAREQQVRQVTAVVSAIPRARIEPRL